MAQHEGRAALIHDLPGEDSDVELECSTGASSSLNEGAASVRRLEEAAPGL